MFSNNQSLDLNQKDIELIESALHTQQKILSVQTEAGGQGAQERLTELKQLIKRIGRQKQAQTVVINEVAPDAAAEVSPPCAGRGFIARSLFC